MVCIQINDQDYVMTREAGDSNHGAMQEDMQVDMDEVFNISTYLSPTSSGPVNVLLTLTLSLLISLSSSLHKHASHFLSLKRFFLQYKSTLVNKYYIFFIFS